MNILSWPQTPLGPLHASLNTAGQITRLHWGPAPAHAAITTSHPAHEHLNQYFNKVNINNCNINIFSFIKGTPFQHRVWAELLTIPHGQTLTYGQLAQRLNTSPRAIGNAVGSNPVPIIIPCHRVMGTGGKLTGFSAPGGLTTKKWLLEHEGIPYTA